MRSKRSISEKLLSWPDLVLLVFFIAFLALALAGSLSPADGTSTVGAAFMPPSAEHPLGTDGLGRDVLARLMHGGAHLIAVAAVSTAVAAAVGVALGFAVSAKGRFADVLSYLLDLLLVIPSILVVMVLVFGLGSGVGTMIVVTTAVSAPYIARYTRSLVRPVAASPYVTAARLSGGEDGCARGASELGGSLGNHGGHEVHQLRLSCCDGRFSRVRPPRNGLRLGNHDTDGRHGHQPEPVGRACSHYRDCLHHHIGQSSA